ncbi:MAG: RagB/SusD family nutrient uptake outer membrane protein [Tannerellaceae bacterium]|jgi:hypothetical protein|nr:RagB/SusD family nutrient uptake outer membrane protein [Tannerellaceae bacterium]
MLHITIKKSIRMALAILSVAFFTNCDDNVTDLSPLATISDLTAYDTPEHCELSVIGAYNAACNGRYNGSYSRGYPFGAASIEQGEMRGEDMGLTAVFYDITFSSSYTTSTANNQYYWEASFECIARVNTVIQGIEEALKNGILTEGAGNNYLAELYFLRALTYSSLLIHFCYPVNIHDNNDYGLPIYTKPSNTPSLIEENLKIGRSTVQETYAQILKDLDEGEKLYSGNARHKVNGISRVSKGSIIALKTRVYLHMREWAKVKTEAAKLTNGAMAPFTSPIGGYALTPSPATPFNSYTNNSESIFSIENSAESNPGVNGALSAMLSARTGGRAIVTSSPILYNSKYWLEDDKRRELLFYRESDKYYFSDKYPSPQTMEEYAPIIRYAEVLLNYSEAALRTGDKTLALELLNAVRNRSLADPATQAYTAADFATEKEFMEAILWERRIEFHAEGRRWEDIHRLAVDDLVPSGGIPAKIDYSRTSKEDVFQVNTEINEKWFSPSRKFIPYSDKRFIWPIPINDIVRYPVLAQQQNKGW